MIRKLFQMLALPDALTASMEPQHRIMLALALASAGYRCISYGLTGRWSDGRKDLA
jgi:hypothetical protein